MSLPSIESIIQKGLDRHKQRTDDIYNSTNLDAKQKHEELVELYYELLDTGSYTDWNFSQGYLSDLLDTEIK